MSTGFAVSDSVDMCFLALKPGQSQGHHEICGLFGTKMPALEFVFSLFLGQNVNGFTTPAFTPHGTDIKIKLHIKNSFNGSRKGAAIQVLLVEPADDIIELEVNGTKAILTGESDSFLYQEPSDGTLNTRIDSAKILIYCFRMTGFLEWRKEFNDLTAVPDGKEVLRSDVVLKVGEIEVRTTKELLFVHSDVFRAMFEHETTERRTGVILITDSPVDVVREMVRFMAHGYCGGWYKWHMELLAIADKYNITAMRKLAVQKMKLIDQMS